MKDTSDISNPNHKFFCRIWTDWSDWHDQKSLVKNNKYLLSEKADPLIFVDRAHCIPTTLIRVTAKREEAKTFHGSYLLSTMWQWEKLYNAVPA